VTSQPDAISLAERVLSILDEGSFSATYKYALFTGLLDLCIEGVSRAGVPPTTVTTRQLAGKVVEIYWPQAVPYAGHGTLRQGGVRRDSQAEIVRRIAQARADWAGSASDTVFRARLRHPREFDRLLDFVEWKLIEMPIPRLQVLGRREDRFLYEYNWNDKVRQSSVSAYQRRRPSTFDNRLLLKPDVADHLVRLNGVLRPLFRRAWTLMVAGKNRLPQAELEVFLFGTDRVPLDAVRSPLLDLQRGRCFYCDGTVGTHGEVDHFVPWSRYADDGLDNLVVAHPRCNNSKRDFLAAADHVERWAVRTREQAGDLATIARSFEWPRDDERTLAVARGVYLPLATGVRLWSAPGQFVPCDPIRIRAALA
jgi:5-methylcytosine-specific restriction endonuclease McrA